MIREVLDLWFFTIGVITTAFIVTFLLAVCTHETKEFLRNQKKIKWLCHHEYELKWADGIDREYDRYIFVCRKCGKKHEIKTYNKITEARTIYRSETMLLVHGKEKEHE